MGCIVSNQSGSMFKVSPSPQAGVVPAVAAPKSLTTKPGSIAPHPLEPELDSTRPATAANSERTHIDSKIISTEEPLRKGRAVVEGATASGMLGKSVTVGLYSDLVDFQSKGDVIPKARTKCESFTPFWLVKASCLLSGNVVQLPRGGVVALTDVGGIQFGAPPETVKDSMRHGMPVPTYFVVYKEMFSRRHGTCTSELEFPAYFNFFVLKKKVTVITTAELEKRIRTVFQETLLGPESEFVNMAEDFASHLPVSCHPQVRQEGEWLDNARKTMKVDSLINFIRFKPVTEDSEVEAATIVEGDKEVKITFDPDDDGFTVKSNTAANCKIPLDMMLHFKDRRLDDSLWGVFMGEGVEGSTAPVKLTRSPSDASRGSIVSIPSIALSNALKIPTFGVTMLGASHGFDANGTTTGFIVWINKRGTMVDPPPHAIDLLNRNGIPPKVIDSIILTHCHGDHDAGTFRRILFDRGVTLYTTNTIFRSFIRKYSAVSGLSAPFLERIIDFQAVKIGEPLCIHGGEFSFFYSLHTIPCIGFQARNGGKKIVYSADTHTNPELVHKMFADGTIGEGRRDGLLEFPWDSDLILHEAGVPPIHTPIAILSALPVDVRSRMYLVHVAKTSVKDDSGLNVAYAGQTMILDVPEPKQQDAYEVLNLLRNIPLLAPVLKTLRVASNVLQRSSLRCYKHGDTILMEGANSSSLYIVLDGTVSSELTDRHGKVKDKFFHVGDFFGEWCLVSGEAHSPISVYARSESVKLALLDQSIFADHIRGTDVEAKVRRLIKGREIRTWDIIECSRALRSMTAAEKTHLQSLLEARSYHTGETIWTVGDVAAEAVLIESGEYTISMTRKLLDGRKREEALGILRQGALVGDINAITTNSKVLTGLVCSKPGTVLVITQADLLKFFRAYPGALINFKDQQWIL